MATIGKKLNFETISDLFKTVKATTAATLDSSPFIGNNSKFKEQADAKGLVDVKIGLSFDDIEEDEAEYNDKTKDHADKAAVIINKLVKYFRTILENINTNNIFMKFNRDIIEANKAEIDDLKKKNNDLEKKCEDVEVLKQKLSSMERNTDEIQQRSMKGNLIVSSPNLQGKDSLLVRKQRLENGQVISQEDDTEMIVRLISANTGVNIPLVDISACHALNKQGLNTRYILRVTNRKPGSAWQTLSAGLLTGKNSSTGDHFTKANVFINFQLTKRRGDLAKEVRKAKYDKGIVKYGTDQNGKITVKVKDFSPWAEVTSIPHLRLLIADPPVSERPRQAWGQQHRQQHQ